MYIISKAINTSYTDVKNMSVIERTLLLSFIQEDSEKLRKDYEQKKKDRKK